MESGGGALRFHLMDEDENGETALALAGRVGSTDCVDVLTAKIEQVRKPSESIADMVGRCAYMR